VALTPPLISGSVYGSATGKYTFEFTTPDDTVTTSSFNVVGATAINGPYSAVSGATITQLSNGAFEASVPISGAIHFYRVQQIL
jgi:hypothetical protein